MSSSSSSADARLDPFSDHLARALCVGTKLRVYHVSTPPVPTTPIFAAPPGQPDEPTRCESHFLAISLPHVTAPPATDQPLAGTAEESHVLVLGIEVLIFSTDSLLTVFVSKADSTGFLPRRAEHQQGSPSIARVVISAFLEWLVRQQLSLLAAAADCVTSQVMVAPPNSNAYTKVCPDAGLSKSGSPAKAKKLVLSLFARSQNQYLFPGSIENVTKHVLGDRQLIRWWCQLIGDLVQKDWPTICSVSSVASHHAGDNDHSSNTGNAHLTTSRTSTNAYVVVPGCDAAETVRSFLPPAAKYTIARPEIETKVKWHTSFPVNLLVERRQVPDEDPLPARCLIPRLPDDPKARYCDDLDASGIDTHGRWKDIKTLEQFWETMEYRQECAAGRLVGFIWVVFSHDSVSAQVEPHIDTAKSTADDRPGQIHQPHAASTAKGCGSVTITNEQYIALMDLLINTTDFAGAELAAKSTLEWIDKVKEFSGLQAFGADVEGQIANEMNGLKTTSTIGKHPRDGSIASGVNVLTVIKKKRQKVTPHVEAETSATAETNSDGKDVLEAQTQPDKGPAEILNTRNTPSGIQTLSAGLVRKKPNLPGA